MRPTLELSIDGRVMLLRPLDRARVRIGSNPECDLCLPLTGVAPVQLVLRHDPCGLMLVNHSDEGTEVAGERVFHELRLADGDALRLGSATATVRFVEETETKGGGGTRTLVPEGPADCQRNLYLTLPERMPNERFAIDRGGLSLGTDPANSVRLDDPYVSAFHVRLRLEGGRCIARDLGSRNGVFVGGLRTKEGEVPVGAQIQVGRSVGVVVSDSADREATGARGLAPSARLIGESPAMRRVSETIRRLAVHDSPVLVTGETGTGKEVVARMLTELSPRAGKPLVVLNCGGLSQGTIASELFGHERGAFTGASSRKAGAFEAAHGGTIFLDEVGELPMDLQPQLLRVLESGEVRRLGSTETFRVDVRLIAATHRSLAHAVSVGSFRQDLFHRLHVLVLDLPALRERRDDIVPLCRHFMERLVPPGQSVKLSAEALDKLVGHDWSGNVRELSHTLERAVLLRVRPDVVDADDVQFAPSTLETRADTAARVRGGTLRDNQREAIETELLRFKGNKTEAAKALGVSRSTVHRKIEEYGIDVGALVA